MTDGIIQEVIRKYMINANLRYESKNVAYRIEQELIEAIKKEVDNNPTYNEYDDGLRVGNNRLIGKLIGDNQ